MSEDPTRIEAVRERIFPKYRAHETDGGGDGEEEKEKEENDGSERALIEITIGPATLQRYR